MVASSEAQAAVDRLLEAWRGEIQAGLVRAARELTSRLGLSRAPTIQGDAAQLAGFMMVGSVFLLYCPFSGPRLEKVLDDLASIARTRTIRVCCVGMTLPERPWLSGEPSPSQDVMIYRSRIAWPAVETRL